MDKLKEIRLALFARRNGIVADGLRAAGDPHHYIMGCQLSDLIALVQQYEPSAPLAQALWDARDHRECRLMAPMLYPAEQYDSNTALRWCHEVLTEEEADVLCHRLLRHLEFTPQLVASLLASDSQLARYVGYRLALNLQIIGRLEVDEPLRQQAVHERDLPHTAGMHQLLTALLEP